MTAEKQAVQTKQHPEVPQAVYMPDVDIREDGETLTVLADLPGAQKEDVDLSVENGVLTIDAKPTIQAPEGYTLAGQEWDYGTFHRTFQLADGVDVEKISASVRNGTLTVTIPKRDEVRTRKIEIGK